MKDNKHMDSKTIRLKNLKSLINEIGTAAALAEKINASPSQISQIVAPKAIRSLGDALARRIEEAFRKPHGWMDQIHDQSSNLEVMDRKIGTVPLISFVSAGLFCESPDNFSPGDAEEWLPCPSAHSPRTYALRVSGDSMTSSTPGERSYPHGTIIFVDPEKAHTIGSRVIARIPGTAESTFKVYSEDMGIAYLVPINPRYPTMVMPEGTVICGVVIGSYMPE